jgi:hypothetical protein
MCCKNPANENKKCFNCRRLGHFAKDCQLKKKDKDKDKGKGGSKGDANNNEAHIVEDEVTFLGTELTEDEVHNSDSYDACNVNAIDDHLIYYDWLANNVTTSHVSCQHNTFTQYTPLDNVSVSGVGRKEAKITSRGTVKLYLTCNSLTYLLHLENVLHIPGQWNNLISLGQCCQRQIPQWEE